MRNSGIFAETYVAENRDMDIKSFQQLYTIHLCHVPRQSAVPGRFLLVGIIWQLEFSMKA